MRALDRSDLLLAGLTFAAGAVDGVCFVGLGEIFTANQTGNLVLLGLAVGDVSGTTVLRSALSVIAFVLGVYAAARLAGSSREPGSWPAPVRAVTAVVLATQAAFLAAWVAASGRPGAVLAAVLVFVAALGMGLQTGAVRAIGVAGVSTTYVTGTLTGLVGEAAGAGGRSGGRRLRAVVVVALPVGAACAALLMEEARTAAPALALAVTAAVLLASRGLTARTA